MGNGCFRADGVTITDIFVDGQAYLNDKEIAAKNLKISFKKS